MNKPQRIFMNEKLTDIGENADGIFFRHHQYIPDEFLQQLRDERYDSLHTPSGNFHRVASIPQALVDQWHAEGFDINTATVPEILARLRKQQFDAFITSNKV
jgi:hypothetical protein